MLTVGELLLLIETHPNHKVSFAGQSGRCLYNKEKQELLFDDEYNGNSYNEVDADGCASLAQMLKCFPRGASVSVMGMDYDVAVSEHLILLDENLHDSTVDVVEESLLRRYRDVTGQTISALIDRKWMSADIQSELGLTYDAFQSYVS